MFEPETVYHVYNCANGRENLFHEKQNYVFFLEKYTHYIQPVAETYAYCLLPNHFHAMIATKSEEEVRTFLDLQGFENLGGLISQRFSNFFNSYTKAFNKLYQRRGSLFRPNVKKKLVKSDQYFTKLILYIHNNPVKHGFVDDLRDWPYSSFHQIEGKSQKSRSSDGLTPSAKRMVIDWFGSLEAFQASHKDIGEIESVFD